MSPLKNQRPKSAFTLIELLVVIAIIGLLATLSIIALNNARAKSRDAKRLADAKQFQTAMELYFNAAGHYPSNADFASGKIEYNSGSGTTTYMQVIPSAPTPADGTCSTTTNAYTYNAPADGSTYTIDFCVAQASPELGGGELVLWSGGISGGTGGGGGAEPPATTCGTGPACPGDMTCVADTRCEGSIVYDSETYPTVRIGTQVWMAKNLNVGTYIGSGTSTIGYDSSASTSDDCVDMFPSNGWWSCQGATGIHKYCHGNNQTNCNTYGGIYEWAEALGLPGDCNNAASTDNGDGTYTLNCPINGSQPIAAKQQGICPSGWHVPAVADMNTLANNTNIDNSDQQVACVFGSTTCAYAGERLKATSGWSTPTTKTDEYGFAALPAGSRYVYSSFGNLSYAVYFWLATPDSSNPLYAWGGGVYSGDPVFEGSSNGKTAGFSVRCLKD